MITFVSGNANKVREVGQILRGVEIEARSLELPEIQSMDVREIVEDKVRAAYARAGGPVIVEDVSMEIDAMKGFPGPFVKWWEKTAGYEAAVALCERAGIWTARAKCGAAFFDGTRLVYSEGIVEGSFTHRAGEEGFGFDFYFIPEGHDETFAQLGSERKNVLSHRARAFQQLRVLLADLIPETK